MQPYLRPGLLGLPGLVVLAVLAPAMLAACGAQAGSDTLRIAGEDDDPVQDHIPEAALVEPDPYDIVAPTGIPLSRRDLLVIFQDDATVGPVNALIASLDASIAGGLPDLGIVQLRVPVAEATSTDEDLRPLLEARAVLKASPLVAAVTLNWFYPTERLPPYDRAASTAWTWVRPWPSPPLDGSGPWGLKTIRMPQAWNLADHAARKTSGLPRPSAGILEGGVDPTLADLTAPIEFTERGIRRP